MTRSRRSHSQQLALVLAPLPEHPRLPAAEEPTLLRALADLLLEALGPEDAKQEIVAISMEGCHEDHA